MENKKSGVELIAEELLAIEGNIDEMLREGQIGNHGELAEMAATFCLPDEVYDFSKSKMVRIEIRRDFIWPKNLSRPRPRTRIKELVKAGALIAAEIDRLQTPQP